MARRSHSRRRAQRNAQVAPPPRTRPVARWRRLVALGCFLLAALAAIAWLQQAGIITAPLAIAAPEVPDVRATPEQVKALESGAQAQAQVLQRLATRGTPVRAGGGAENLVALTFDDGPSPHTPAVLKALRAQGVRASFFLIGRQAQADPQAVAAIGMGGHDIGAHTRSHADLTRLPRAQIPTEVTGGFPGGPPTFFRPPYGATNAAVDGAARDMGAIQTLWDVDSHDWQDLTAAQITARVLADATAGSIILLHDGGGNRTATVAAIAPIIRGLRARGLEPVTLTRLLGSDPPPAAP